MSFCCPFFSVQICHVLVLFLSTAANDLKGNNLHLKGPILIQYAKKISWRRRGSDLLRNLSCDRRQDLCDRERHCLEMCFAILCLFLLDFRAYNHGLKEPQKPKTYCDNKLLRSYLSPRVSAVRSGAMWRQDLAILSPEGSRDSTFQLRKQ